jgi:UDP:flavonoid glycosyltransferase YjiC (YdhE family)
VRDVLRDPGYRKQAIRLREQIRTLPGPEQAVGLLEQLTGTAGRQGMPAES